MNEQQQTINELTRENVSLKIQIEKLTNLHNTGQKQLPVYAEIEQELNFISSLSGTMEELLKVIFLRLCQLDHVDFGCLYIDDEKTQSLELLFHYNLEDDFVAKFKSISRDMPQYDIVAMGIPQYEYIGFQPQSVQDSFPHAYWF